MKHIPSPLNYTGGKFKLLPQLLPRFPKEIDTFVDLFCGGCNVGLNVDAERVIFNDISAELIRLYTSFHAMDMEQLFGEIEGVIDTYGLTRSNLHGYNFYNCNSSMGLGPANREAFLLLREACNDGAPPPDSLLLYVLIVYAFNNQIRFNREGKFNLPVGKRDFNDRMREKLRGFLERLESGNYSFTCKDFRDFDTSILTEQSLVYCDPPYLITCASYNEQGGWTEKDELDLLAFLDELDLRGRKFALSNVFASKGRENTLLMEWAKRYRVAHLRHHYKNANYQRKGKTRKTDEVLIMNY